jgi:hypothetical protein
MKSLVVDHLLHDQRRGFFDSEWFEWLVIGLPLVGNGLAEQHLVPNKL